MRPTLQPDRPPAAANNLYYGGYNLETKPGSKIGKDLLAGDYQSVLAGECRSLSLFAAAVELDGAVRGDATIRVAEPGQYPAQWSGNFSGFWIDLPLPGPAA